MYCGLQTKLPTPRLRLPTPTPDFDSHLAPTLRPPRRVAGAVSAVQRPPRPTPAGRAARGPRGRAPPPRGPAVGPARRPAGPFAASPVLAPYGRLLGCDVQRSRSQPRRLVLPRRPRPRALIVQHVFTHRVGALPGPTERQVAVTALCVCEQFHAPFFIAHDVH